MNVSNPVAVNGGNSFAMRKIDAFGEDRVCNDLRNGNTMTATADYIGVSVGSLITWIGKDPDRSARVRESRMQAAAVWDEMAETLLRDAPGVFELAKAREVAFHLRWRASKIAPRDYGDRVQQEISGKDGGPIKVEDIRPPIGTLIMGLLESEKDNPE